MHHLKAQHNPSELLALSRHAEGRISHRFLAIRDILLERSRHWICEQYGITRETLRQWVSWYNQWGVDGLSDALRSGRPAKLSAAQQSALCQRISIPPNLKTDGIGRWRAVDIQRLLAQEYGVHYRSVSGISSLLHRLHMAWISGRPHNPRQEEGAVESFKKTPRRTGKPSPKIPRKVH